MIIMARSTEMSPTAARLMPKTVTALEDWTMNVKKAATRKARASESPVRSSMSRNQGCSASGAAASVRRTSPTMSMAPPRKDAATGLNFDSRSLATGEPEDVERNDLDVEGDDHDQGGHADGPAEDQGKRPPGRDQPGSQDAHHDECHRGHALGDGAGEGPQTRAENGFAVHRPAVLRCRLVANALRFSVRSYIPTMKRPSPPLRLSEDEGYSSRSSFRRAIRSCNDSCGGRVASRADLPRSISCASPLLRASARGPADPLDSSLANPSPHERTVTGGETVRTNRDGPD